MKLPQKDEPRGEPVFVVHVLTHREGLLRPVLTALTTAWGERAHAKMIESAKTGREAMLFRTGYQHLARQHTEEEARAAFTKAVEAGCLYAKIRHVGWKNRGFNHGESRIIPVFEHQHGQLPRDYLDLI